MTLGSNLTIPAASSNAGYTSVTFRRYWNQRMRVIDGFNRFIALTNRPGPPICFLSQERESNGFTPLTNAR
jgi:hypothetical protein